MTDLRAFSDPQPFAAAAFEQFADLDVKGHVRHSSSAKFCGLYTQHFANAIDEIASMPETPINKVVAAALKFYMGERWKQTTLGEAAGVAANTVGNALNPERRETPPLARSHQSR